jgi:hypothetical protein
VSNQILAKQLNLATDNMQQMKMVYILHRHLIVGINYCKQELQEYSLEEIWMKLLFSQQVELREVLIRSCGLMRI